MSISIAHINLEGAQDNAKTTMKGNTSMAHINLECVEGTPSSMMKVNEHKHCTHQFGMGWPCSTNIPHMYREPVEVNNIMQLNQENLATAIRQTNQDSILCASLFTKHATFSDGNDVFQHHQHLADQ